MWARWLTESALVLILESRNLDLEKVLSSAGRSTWTTSLFHSVVLLIILMNISNNSVREGRDSQSAGNLRVNHALDLFDSRDTLVLLDTQSLLKKGNALD